VFYIFYIFQKNFIQHIRQNYFFRLIKLSNALKSAFTKFNFCACSSDHEDGKKQKRGEEGLKRNNSEAGRQEYQGTEGKEGRGRREHIKKEPDPDPGQEPEQEQEQEPESSSEEEEEPPAPYDKVPGEAPLKIQISCQKHSWKEIYAHHLFPFLIYM
jgi:hypothetical protein